MPARCERRFLADPESMKRVVALLLAPDERHLGVSAWAAGRAA